MKPSKLVIVKLFAVSLLLPFSVQAAQIGVLQTAGTGCDIKVGVNKLTPIKGFKTRFSAPIQISEDKINNAIVRKSCAFSLPIKLGPSEKLQIVNPTQTISL